MFIPLGLSSSFKFKFLMKVSKSVILLSSICKSLNSLFLFSKLLIICSILSIKYVRHSLSPSFFEFSKYARQFKKNSSFESRYPALSFIFSSGNWLSISKNMDISLALTVEILSLFSIKLLHISSVLSKISR